MGHRSRVVAAGVGLALLLTGCRGDRAPRSPEPPTPAAAGLPRCQILPSQLRPLIVEWPGADRGSLEHQIRAGVVAVRYEGCALEVLRSCRAVGQYGYAGFNRKRDTVAIQSVDDLYNLMPSGAARLEPRLVRGHELQVDMTLVGMYTTDRTDHTRDDLIGECDKATHVLTAAQVGAFSFYSGAAAAYGETSRSHEAINSDGDPAACAAATTADSAPPEGCGALLRLELTPLLAAAQPVAAPVADASPPRPKRRDRSARAPRKKSDGRHADRAATAFVWIGGILFGGGLISGGVWFANKVKLNNTTFEMKEYGPNNPKWQELEAKRAHYDRNSKGSGWATAAIYLVAGPSLVLGILARNGGIRMSRVGVTPIVQRTYGGLSLSFRF